MFKLPTYRRISPILAITLASLLAGCATDNPASLRRIELTKGVGAEAKTCCNALSVLLERAQPLTLVRTNLDPDTDHFDVGHGLAPIQVFRLDPSSRAVEVHAPLQLLGFAYGGDGRARHLDAQIHFMDSAGKRLSTPEPYRIVRYLGNGYRALFYYLNVPPGAAYVGFTTDPKRNGVPEKSPMEGMPATGFLVGSVPMFIPGSGTSSYTLTNYSPVQFQALNAVFVASSGQQ